MSKAETVDKLIDMGFDYEEVLERSKGKPSFVKGRFTKKGKAWKKPPELELPAEAEPVAEKRDEGSDQSGDPAIGTEEQSVHSEDLKYDPDKVVLKVNGVEIKGFSEDKILKPKAIKLESEHIELYARIKKYQDSLDGLPTIRRARTGKYLSIVIDILENQDFSSQRQSAMNCRYMMIGPRPTGLNFYKEVFNIHKEMKQVFSKSRK